MILRASLRAAPRTLLRSLVSSATLRSSLKPHANLSSRLNLDPSYQALFNDIDVSMKKSRVDSELVHRELEIVYDSPVSGNLELSTEEWLPLDGSVESDLQEDHEDREHRKSPAALFGSNQIPMVVLPSELQTAIGMLISGG